MDSSPAHSGLRSRLFRGLRIPAAVLGLATLYVAVVGIAIDVSSRRDELADKLSTSLGREVLLTGAIQLDISARPKLRMSGLHISNPSGFGADDFASLKEARLALNLWPLLWGNLQVEELAGSDAHLRLQARKDGSNNWTFRKDATHTPAPEQKASGPAPEHALAMLDIKRVSLQTLGIEYVGPDGKVHYFHLNSLVARVPVNQPLSLSLNGTVERTFPYQIELTGGPLTELLAAEKPWPVTLSLNFLSSRLALKGTLSDRTANLHFDLASKDLSEIERLLQTRLPAAGETRVAGDVAFAPGRLRLANLEGQLGNTTLAGALDLDHGGPRPQLRGEISLPVLDLRPFMTGQPAAAEVPEQSMADMYRDFARASFDLHALNDMDADLTVKVGTWLNAPGAVRDATLQVKLDHGRLAMPIQATMAGVTVRGAAHADAAKKPARFAIELGARDSGIGSLAGLLLGVPDIKGDLARFDLRITARGNHGAELMDSLVVQLGIERARLSYGNKAGARPVRFSLDHLVVDLPAGKPLHGEAHGTLLDRHFSMSLNGASLKEILQESNAAVEFSLQAGSASAQVHALLQPQTEVSGRAVRFSLDAPHSSEISSWLGLKPGADVPVRLRGHLQTRKQGWDLSGFSFQLGQSRLSAEVQQFMEQNRPLVKLQLNGDLIDADELKSLLPETPADSLAQAPPSAEAIINIPILPQGVSLADADITVRIGKIATRSPFSVHNLRFDGRIRDGMMTPSPFAANIGHTDFNGAILLDLRTQQPKATLWLAGETMNIGSILQRLDIARNVEAKLGRLYLYMDLHSSRLGELLAQSELSISFEGGILDVRDANTGGAVHIALDGGELKSAPGAPVTLNINGALDQAPVSIGIQTAPAADLLNPALPIPFTLKASTSDTTLSLSGNVNRPLARNDAEVTLDMRGSRLDRLNALMRASLPPWGPWSASGRFRMSPAGYEVASLLVQVGSSRLYGNGKLDTTAAPPRLDVELTAPTIQIDDFRFGNWTPEQKQAATPTTASRRTDETSAADVQQLLSREVLGRQNAYLLVRVDQVLSGKEVLGNGALAFRLQDGRADIGPVVISTPGGAAMVRLNYEPRENDVVFNLWAGARRFDYGILARRIDKSTEMSGTLDLDVDVSARARNFSELLRHGKGHIDFAVWPENMKSGLLDLWAVNVLMALLPAVDSSSESTVNCAVGQFNLQAGKLSHKRLLVDTTRMRVSGKGHVDFTTEEIRFYMRPRSKTPQFLSFPLPVELTGSFDDFRVGVRPGDALETAGQLVTSVVWVPLQSLFGKPLPADGSDVCQLK